MLSRWPAAGVDLDLPDTSVEVWLDGKRFEGLAPLVPSDGYASAVRVPMPEPKPGRPAAVLDVRFVCPKATLHQTLSAPHVRSATAKAPPRWQVVSPSGTVALNPSGELTAETRWLWHHGRILPTPVGSTADLDRWILDGTEPTTTGEEGTWDCGATNRRRQTDRTRNPSVRGLDGGLFRTRANRWAIAGPLEGRYRDCHCSY